MKWIILFLFHSSLIFAQPKLEISPTVKSLLLETMFQDSIFYKLRSLNLTYADSITVLDKSDFFKDCESIEIKKKKLVIKRMDLIPFPLKNGWEGSEFSEECLLRYGLYYFILDKPEINENVIKIKFFVLVSNHVGYFSFKIDKDNISLIEKKLGQY